MPLYDYKCNTCETVKSNVYHRLFAIGPSCCDATMEIIPAQFAVGGILFGDELDLSDQMDLVFKTDAQYRDWVRENPNMKVSTQHEFKQERIRSRERADAHARSKGFSNHDEMAMAIRSGDLSSRMY